MDDSSPKVPSTPPLSRSSSSNSASRRKTPPLSLDLSDLPPLIQPSPPSNTLIITNLHDPALFQPAALAHLRQLITNSLPSDSLLATDSEASAPAQLPHAIHSFAPLPSLSRILVSFTTIQASTHTRTLLDNTFLLSSHIRVYFGAPTPLDLTSHGTSRLLKAPQAAKQFFISPPPSPPHGWVSTEEGPPNREICGADLAKELERLMHRSGAAVDAQNGAQDDATGVGRLRSVSGSSIVLYRPEDQGASPDLPAIAVEDVSWSEGYEHEDVPDADPDRRIRTHTARPPVELMADN